jgi:hypothetical protein
MSPPHPGGHEFNTHRQFVIVWNTGHWPESIAAINSNLPPINSTLSAQLLANKPHFFGINHYTSKCALAPLMVNTNAWKILTFYL